MTTNRTAAGGALAIDELKEFAGFAASDQRYIRRSIDVAFARRDAIACWSRDISEAASIRAQTKAYVQLPMLRALIPLDQTSLRCAAFLGRLITLTSFDLGQMHLSSFAAYRFLYERLLGASARPWFPAAFCAAAALPNLPPAHRRMLLHSISEAAATAPGWSACEPLVFPEWIEPVDD